MATQHTEQGDYRTAAEKQFNTSSTRDTPAGYTAWKIRNDYPPPKPPGVTAHAPYDAPSLHAALSNPVAWSGNPRMFHTNTPPQPSGVTVQAPYDAPWLNVSLTNPEEYMAIMKEYCFEGMTNTNFVPQKNRVRAWYHAPWMHFGDAGREPLHGLTSERCCPPRELSATQQRTTQTWAVGFFNSAGASVFGGMWRNPSKPDWSQNIHFPPGTAIFKLLYTNATDLELPNMTGAPEIKAMIAIEPDDPTKAPDPKNRLTDQPARVRLLQMDIATRDDRSKTGWVWGTYMYNGLGGLRGYEGMIPVGLSWGLVPKLTQEAYDRGERPKQVWINPDADAVRLSLHGGRPSWGWNGRLNGPADNFISACQSCHASSQWNPKTQSQGASMVPPKPVLNAFGQFVPNNDNITMTWFQNIPCGTPVTKDGAVSGDYSLQLLIGYENFVAWEATQTDSPTSPRSPRSPAHRRQGPDMGF